jgi:hypothetical protein
MKNSTLPSLIKYERKRHEDLFYGSTSHQSVQLHIVEEAILGISNSILVLKSKLLRWVVDT